MLVCCSLTLQAQNWNPFPEDQPTYFEFEQIGVNGYSNYGTAPYFVDSITTIGNRTYQHILRKHLEQYVGDCYETFLNVGGFYPLRDSLYKENDWYYYQSYQDILPFNPLAQVGETWDYEDSQFQWMADIDFLRLSCDSIGTTSFLGITDSVKYFSVQSYENNAPSTHAISNARYVLSKNHGFIEFVPFYDLRVARNYQGTLIGMEIGGNLQGVDQIMDFADFLPYQVGDILVWRTDEGDAIDLTITQQYYRYDTITSITVTDSLFSYTFNQKSLYIDLYNSDTFESYNPNQTKTYNISEMNNVLKYAYWNTGFTHPLSAVDYSLPALEVSVFKSQNGALPEYQIRTQADFPIAQMGCFEEFFAPGADNYYNTELGYVQQNVYYEAPFFTDTYLINYIKAGSVEFSGKLYLEGNYNPDTDRMEAYNLVNHIPLQQPYNQAPYNYTGTESITNINYNVVDWVLVEARSGTPNIGGTRNTVTVETRAALLYNDGTIKDIDGTEGVRFQNLQEGTAYHFCIRHRNHLDILTANPLIAKASMSLYDFTTSADQALGNGQQKTATNGKAVLFAGDYSVDGTIQVTDYDAWKTSPAQLDTYSVLDGNLDGVVQVTDFDVWLPNKAKIGTAEIQF